MHVRLSRKPTASRHIDPALQTNRDLLSLIEHDELLTNRAILLASFHLQCVFARRQIDPKGVRRNRGVPLDGFRHGNPLFTVRQSGSRTGGAAHEQPRSRLVPQVDAGGDGVPCRGVHHSPMELRRVQGSSDGESASRAQQARHGPEAADLSRPVPCQHRGCSLFSPGEFMPEASRRAANGDCEFAA